eukprot:scaffold28567_cov21-Tisochrysis_lutea.AAC.1
METYVGKGNSPYINEGKGVILAQKSHKSPPPQSLRQKALVEICMVTGITGLQNLALRNVIVFNCTPSGNEFVDMLYSTGMKFLSKLTNILLVKVVLSVLSVARPTNTQKNGLHAAAVLPPTLSRPRAYTVLYLNQVHMLLVCIQLMRLPYARICAGPLCGPVPAAHHVV